MKIAINVRFLIKDKLEGIGVFTFESLKCLVNNHKDHHFYFLFDRKPDDSFVFADNITAITINPPARHPVLWYIWFNYSVPEVLKKIKPDIFVSMDGFIPLKPRFKTLNVIHDIAFEHYPDDIDSITSKYYRKYFPMFASRADRIATVSEFSKNDIAEKYNIDKGKIDVVYNGAGELFKPLDEKVKSEVKESITGGADYFVYIGALHSRKNISALLRSFDVFAENINKKFMLVIIGRKAWKTNEMMNVYEHMKHKDKVIFTGRLTDELMAKYLGAAHALTYISYFEGFGLPVLEAMKCDIPVITSSKSSLPEIAGNAGLIVDPFNIEDIALAMKQIAEDNELRLNLIANARLQREKFSWGKTSDLLWDSIQSTLRG